MMLLLKKLFSPKDDKIGHCGTLLQSAIAIEMFFILKDAYSF